MKKAAPALPGNETTPFDQQREDTSSGPFGQWTHPFIKARLFPVPLGGDDGKTALMKWKNPSRKQAIFLSLHQPKFAAANIGFITGQESGVTVIDIDITDELLLIRAENHFGKTPLIVRTARSKWHLYYAYNGERRRTRHFGDDVPVDLLGDRGICVAPPSATAFGVYRFWRGSLADLSRLPKINPGALDAFEGHQATGFAYRSSSAAMPKPSTPRPRENTGPTSTVRAIRHAEQLSGMVDGPIPEGGRNKACFSRGLRLALGIYERNGSQEDLAQQLEEWNRQNCTPPLDRQEVEQVAGKCWEMTLSGDNWVGTGDPCYEMSKLIRGGLGSDALALLNILKADHKHRPTFAISPEGMETGRVIPGWNMKRYRKARNELDAAGLIVCTHRGGRGKGDPSQFRFGSKAAISAANKNSHPSPLLLPASSQTPVLAKSDLLRLNCDLLGDAVPSLMNAVTFGATVKRLRAERGWTVEQLAGMAGLARTTLTNIELGRYLTTAERQQRILGCLLASKQAAA